LHRFLGSDVRRLTIKELSRIQSFPADYVFKGTKKDIIMQIGNAVACKFAYHIGNYIQTKLAENDILDKEKQIDEIDEIDEINEILNGKKLSEKHKSKENKQLPEEIPRKLTDAEKKIKREKQMIADESKKIIKNEKKLKKSTKKEK